MDFDKILMLLQIIEKLIGFPHLGHLRAAALAELEKVAPVPVAPKPVPATTEPRPVTSVSGTTEAKQFTPRPLVSAPAEKVEGPLNG